MYEKFNTEIEPNVFTLEEYASKKDASFKMNCPHVRIRGKKVTPEQAIEIVAKTEQFFMWHDYRGRWHHRKP